MHPRCARICATKWSAHGTPLPGVRCAALCTLPCRLWWPDGTLQILHGGTLCNTRILDNQDRRIWSRLQQLASACMALVISASRQHLLALLSAAQCQRGKCCPAGSETPSRWQRGLRVSVPATPKVRGAERTLGGAVCTVSSESRRAGGSRRRSRDRRASTPRSMLGATTASTCGASKLGVKYLNARNRKHTQTEGQMERPTCSAATLLMESARHTDATLLASFAGLGPSKYRVSSLTLAAPGTAESTAGHAGCPHRRLQAPSGAPRLPRCGRCSPHGRPPSGSPASQRPAPPAVPQPPPLQPLLTPVLAQHAAFKECMT